MTTFPDGEVGDSRSRMMAMCFLRRFLLGIVFGALLYATYTCWNVRPSNWMELFGIAYRTFPDGRHAFSVISSPNRVIEHASPSDNALRITSFDSIPLSYLHRHTSSGGANGNKIVEGSHDAGTMLTIGHLYEETLPDDFWDRLLPFVQYIEKSADSIADRVVVLNKDGNGYLYKDTTSDGFLDSKVLVNKHKAVDMPSELTRWSGLRD